MPYAFTPGEYGAYASEDTLKSVIDSEFVPSAVAGDFDAATLDTIAAVADAAGAGWPEARRLKKLSWLIKFGQFRLGIWARDPERAREAMRRHLLGGIKRYRALTRPKLSQDGSDNG